MNTIKYSVVICAYNEEKYLKQCIESLLNQSYNHNLYEIIVVDNESNDRTPDIVTSFFNCTSKNSMPLLRYFRIKHVGLSSSRNFSIKQSKGNIIIFIDGDAIVDNDLISEYDKVFSESDCDYSGGRIDLLNKDSYLGNILQNTKYKQIFRGKKKKNFLHGANMAFRKKIFDKYHFIENFYSRGDDSSFIAVISRTYHYCPAEKALVYHERPEKISELIKIIFIEMFLSYKVSTLVEQMTGRIDSGFFKSIISNLLITLSIILSFFNPLFLLITIMFILRFKRQNFHQYSNISDIVFSFLMIVIQIIFIPIIFPYSYIVHRKEKLISGVPITILETK